VQALPLFTSYLSVAVVSWSNESVKVKPLMYLEDFRKVRCAECAAWGRTRSQKKWHLCSSKDRFAKKVWGR
jgi:hypothetical protein